MEKQDLRKFKRKDLLELLLKQATRIKELEDEIIEINKELESKKINIKESGSIAEAALKLNNIFEDAQKSIDDYVSNVKDMRDMFYNSPLEKNPPKWYKKIWKHWNHI